MINKLRKIFNIITEKQNDYKEIQIEMSNETVFDIIDKMYENLTEDVVKIEIGRDIADFIEEITSVMSVIRSKIKDDTGFIFPVVRFSLNDDLQENEVIVFLNGRKLYSKFFIPTPLETAKGIEEILYDLFNNNLNEIFTNEAIEKYMDSAKKYNNKLISDISYNLSSVEIKYILVDLLRQKKSIKNISYIFEKISAQIYTEKAGKKSQLIELSNNIAKSI